VGARERRQADRAVPLASQVTPLTIVRTLMAMAKVPGLWHLSRKGDVLTKRT
jgi:hypothetical protein